MKLTEHELVERLDKEFEDCDFQISHCATKGVVKTVYFYEDKLSEEEWNRTLGREQMDIPVVDEDYGCVVGQHQDYHSPIFHKEIK
jgi:hypothetical protein